MHNRTAAALVIGNEILSGKVVDTNAAFLCGELRALGVELKRIVVIPDELDAIAEAIVDLHPRFEVLFTSGGVGPTHDDITIEGIARGLGRRVIRHPVLEEKIRAFSGTKINEAQLKMADVPEGAELIYGDDLNFPAVMVENIYILPGIPELFRSKFLALKSRFAADPYYLRVIYTSENETSIAEHLNATMAEFPELLLGSYPKLNHPEYRVRLTLESKDRAYLERAFTFLLERLPHGAILRTESPEEV